MKKLITVFLMGLFFFFSCQNEVFEPEPEILSFEKSGFFYEEGSIISTQIESKWLRGNLLDDPVTHKVNIYIPKGYNKNGNERYPVVYLLHGQPSSENSFFESGPFEVLKQIAGFQFSVDFPQEGFVEWLNMLMETEGMKKAIIVMADATNKFGFSFYTNSPTHGNYENYICKELVRYVDCHFKTIPTAKARLVAGHCMGGYGALRLAIKYPNVFGNVAGLSPVIFTAAAVEYCANLMPMEDQMWGFEGPTIPFDHTLPYKFLTNTMYGAAAAWLPNPDNPPFFLDLPFTYDPDGTPVLDEELMKKWDAQELFGLVQTYQDRMKRLNHIYFDVGLYDELGLTTPNNGLHQMMEAMEIPHEFDTFEGGHISHVYSRLEKVLVDFSEISFNPHQHRNYNNPHE